MRILVVDDSADNLRLFQAILEKNNYDVTIALNGEEALQILRNTPADLILSDILMPVMDGFRFLQECKADAKLQKIPFIFITGAFLDKKDEELALKMGVVAFVRKPVELDNLISLVEEVLSQGKSKKKGKTTKTEKAVIEKQISISLMEKLKARMQELEEEITERKKAESALRQAEAEFRLLFDTMAQGVTYQDANGNIISANAAAERILGLSHDQLFGRNSYDPRWRAIQEDGTDFPGDSHPSMIAFRTGKPVKGVVMGIFNPVDDRFHWIKINAVPQFRPGEQNAYQVYATFDDVTDQFLTFKALQEHESRLNAILENTTDAIVSVNRDLRVTAANEAAKKYCSLVAGKVEVGSNLVELLPTEHRAFWDNILKQVLGGQSLVFENHFDTDKGPIDLEFSVSPIFSPSGQITGISFFGREVTTRKRLEESIQKTNRLYKMLYQCNEAVVMAVSEQQLLQNICNVMVETGGYRMVWVGFSENDESKTVRLVTHCGFSDNYLESADFTWSDDELGSSPTGKAIRSGTSVVVQDLSVDPDFILWLESAQKQGYAATIALPVKSYWQTIGALTIYSAAANTFDQDEINLLEQLVADLAYGITSLRERNQREQAEEALRESEQRFRKAVQSTTDIVWDWNIDSGQVDWFGDIDGMLGYGQAEFPRTMEAWENQLHPDDHDRVIAALNLHAQTGEPYNIEYRIRSKDGSIRNWIDRGLVLRDRAGNIIRSVGACVDITDHRLEEAGARIRRDLAIALASKTDLDSALQMSLDAAIKIAGMESGVIYLLNNETGDYKSVYNQNVSAPTMEVFSVLSANSEDADLLSRGRPLYVAAGQFTPRYEKQFKSEGWTFTATLPVMHGEKAVACFIVCSHHLTELPGIIRSSLETMAADIGAVIERIRSREALQASEERYRFITEHTRDVIWVLDKELHYTYVSPSITQQRGYTVDEFKVFSLSQVATPESLEKAVNTVLGNVPGDNAHVNDGTYTSTMELELIRKDGTTFWAEESTTVLITPEGEFAGMIGVSRDITERRKLETELIEREAMFRVVFDNHFQFTGLLDPEGHLLAVNNTALQFAEVTEKDVIGKYFWETPWWQHSAEIQQQLKEAIGKAASGERIHFDTSNINARGEIRQVDFTLNPVLDDAGKVIYMVPEGRDITDVVITQKALKESEERYRKLTESTVDIIATVDLDLVLTYVNNSVRQILGYDLREVVGLPLSDVVTPSSYTALVSTFAEDLSKVLPPGSASETQEIEFIKKDGSTLWTEGKMRWLRDADQKPIGAIAVIRDITERKLTADALRDSEEKYRAVVENATEGIIVLQDGKAKFVNRNSPETLGYITDEIFNRPFIEFIHADDRQAVIERYQRRMAGEVINEPLTIRLMSSSGPSVWVEIRAVAIEWEGKPATLNFLTDITQRKQAEEELQMRAFLLDSTYDTVIAYKLDGKIIYTNEAATNSRGFTREEFLQMNIRQLLPERNLPIFENRLQILLDTGNLSFETVHVRKDGSEFDVEAQGRRIDIAGNKIFVVVYRDITERKKAESELNSAFETITSTLEGTMEAIAMMSELRDPYTAGHQKMVTHLALAIGKEMGLLEERLHGLRVAGLLHDVGKVYVPSEILSKPGKLSELEMGLAKAHASAGYDIVKAIKFPWPVDEMVHQHHERIDGSGYPRGLKGDQIMLEARILAVADTVEAMMSHRPYRPALGLDKALAEIIQNRGKLYDENVVDACVLLFREKGFKFPE